MSYLRFFLFGLPRIERDGHLLSINRRKSLALAAYLALNQEPQSRDTLATFLWPEFDQNTARASLRTTLWQMRKIFGPDILKIEREHVVFIRSPLFWVDVNRFQDLVAESRSQEHSEKEIDPASIHSLTQAVELYRDEFMSGFFLQNCEPFEDWKRSQIDSLTRALIGSLGKLVDFYDSMKAYEQAAQYARHWLKTDPLDESAHGRLMKLYLRMNQPASALRQYEECVRILAEELNTEPQETIKNLYREIKSQRSGSQTDLSQKEQIFFSISNGSMQAGFCIGREKERTEISKLLAEPNCRLLSLTGLGGIGKTVLAQQALMDNAGKFANGVCFTSLTHAKSFDWIVPAIAEALKLSFPMDEDPQKLLIHHIGNKKILLVLDSFEHLLEGAELLMEFLNAAPYLKILVTSRQRLNLKWEWVLEIQGLDYPRNETDQDIERFDAVQLFLQSVRRIHPGFSLSAAERPFVARICRFLEGMPLGLELAATWARMLSSREIASEVERDIGFLATTLSDMPERHRSLQKVFDYSWQLLSEEEKTVLKQLSVFHGGFGKEAAEEVGRVSLQMLMALIDKNFLYRNRNGRFEILEVIRQFIKEQTPPAVENLEEIQIRHADYYVRFLSQRDQPTKRFKYKRAMDEIGMEIENIRAGWQWSVLSKNTILIGQYLESLFSYYELKGWYFYGEDALSKAVVVLQYSFDVQTELKGVIAKVLSAQGWLCHFLTHFQKAKGLLQTSISIFERLNMKPELGTAFFRLGHVLYDTGQLKQAEESIGKGLSVFKEINDVRGIWACMKNLGNIRLISDAYAEAKSLYEQCLNAYREMGDPYNAAGVLLNLGILMELQEHFDEAKRFYGESLLCYREIDDQTRISICLTDLGFAHFYCDEYQEAETYFKDSLKIALNGNSRFMTQSALLGMAIVQAQPEKRGMVFEIIGQILNDPLTHVWDRKRTERLLERLRPQISEAFLKSSMEKGQNTDLAYYTDWYRTNGFL